MWRGRKSFCMRVSGNGKTGMKQDRIFLSLSCLCLPRLQIQCPGVPKQGRCGEIKQQIIKNLDIFNPLILGINLGPKLGPSIEKRRMLNSEVCDTRHPKIALSRTPH